MTRYIVSYRKGKGWTTVYDGTNAGEAWSARLAESAKGRTLVCFSEAKL